MLIALCNFMQKMQYPSSGEALISLIVLVMISKVWQNYGFVDRYGATSIPQSGWACNNGSNVLYYTLLHMSVSEV